MIRGSWPKTKRRVARLTLGTCYLDLEQPMKLLLPWASHAIGALGPPYSRVPGPRLRVSHVLFSASIPRPFTRRRTATGRAPQRRFHPAAIHCARRDCGCDRDDLADVQLACAERERS